MRWSQDGPIVHLLLDGPPLNLLSTACKEALITAGDQIAARWPEVRVVILSGAGDRAFCAGADMLEFAERIASGKAADAARLGQALARRWLTMPQVTIAALSGAALGGGAELAICCDFRLAGEDLRIGLPEVTRGWFPGNGGIRLLERIVGAQRARRLLLSGEILSAEQAAAVGLVDQVLPVEQVASRAREWAMEWAGKPAQAIARVKGLLDGPFMQTAEQSWLAEAELFAAVFATHDAREGVSAFFEKRTPRFTHR